MWRDTLKDAYRSLVRARNPVLFGDLRLATPVSRKFGLDRGSPIDRYYIERHLRENEGSITGRGLEVGEVRYLNAYGSSTEKSIIVPVPEAAKEGNNVKRTVIGDLTKRETLPSNEFDAFVCTQTIHLIYDFAGAIHGAHQLLAPGGVFIGTVPGISQISRYDMDRWGDNWRFTTRSMSRALQSTFGEVTVSSYGNVLAAQALLLGVSQEDLPDRSLLDAHDNDYQVIIGFVARKR